MTRRRPQSPSLPLDEAALRALAAAYGARFQTTQMRLAAYLARKLRERGWAGKGEPPVADLVARQVDLGAVDDAAWAQARAVSLQRRGLGPRRVEAALAAGGIGAELRSLVANGLDPIGAAEAYARRRRIGKFRMGGPGDQEQRRRDLMAMLRAGHDSEAARAVLTGEADIEAEGPADAGAYP